MAKKKNSDLRLVLISLGILAVVIVAIIIFSSVKQSSSKQILEVSYYDADGNPLSVNPLAVVNNIEGVKYISVDINALNKDTIPLKFEIISISPVAFQSSVNSLVIEADPEQYATWTSGLIDIEPFIGTTQTFQVSIKAYSDMFRQPVTKTAQITFNVEENPQANFDVQIESSLGDTVDVFYIITSNVAGWSNYQTSSARLYTDRDNNGIQASYCFSSAYVSQGDMYSFGLENQNAETSDGFVALTLPFSGEGEPYAIRLYNPSIPNTELEFQSC